MKLNLAPESDLTRPEMENIKLRLHRVETKEISTVTLGAIANSLLITRGDIIVRNATIPERLALTVPSSPTVNFLGVANGETQPSWKSASAAPGAAAAVLQTDASGYLQLVRLGVGRAPTYIVDAQSANALTYRAISSTALGTTSGGGMTLEASALPTAANQRLGLFAFGADDGAGNNISPGLIAAFSAAAWTVGSDYGIYYDFETTPIGSTSRQKRMRITDVGNVKIAGTAVRATTEGTNHLDIFDGTAPVGTLSNGCSIYSTAGELRVMDAAGNATLISPHDRDGYWVFDSKDTVTGRRLRIDVEKMLRAINERFGWDFVKEFASA